MATIWAFRSLARAAVVTGFPKPGGVHLHANLSNLAACSFSAQRLKYPKASRSPMIKSSQNLYGNILVNNIQCDVTLNRFISNRVKKDHLYRYNKPNRIQKHTQAKNGVNSKTSEEDQSSVEKNTSTQTIQSEQTEKDSLSEKTLQSEGTENKDKTEDKPLSIFQRFKKAYKEHGKILVCVHIATSTVWFGSFYYAAKTGFDIVPLLEKWNFSETVIKPFKSSGLGNIAVAYLMYKLATPARYTVTLGGTNLCIKYFRKTGKMPPKAEDSLREIYKDGRDRFQERKKNVTSQLRQKRLKAVEKAKLKRRKH